jgi:hypothetical protein
MRLERGTSAKIVLLTWSEIQSDRSSEAIHDRCQLGV